MAWRHAIARLAPCLLYRAYQARDFRSRWGFSYRLYYPAQVCGKLNRWDETYHTA